jgi:hypothetical protein
VHTFHLKGDYPDMRRDRLRPAQSATLFIGIGNAVMGGGGMFFLKDDQLVKANLNGFSCPSLSSGWFSRPKSSASECGSSQSFF